ncbi:MAG: hypothetical protein DHS20C14_10860 [Phycisphaeraceae bacterium]|nr:MAG: hypothetical protein DHS20C14_10860 [Phycisphaeraceae bacterium]
MTRSTTLRLGLAISLTSVAGLAVAGPDGHAKHADHHAASHHTPLSELVPFEQPELWVGSEAPELAIAKFYKGESVHEFEKGHVYVVEFWATWCGPCIRAFPHLSELQEEHAGDVTFIGVNIWESSRRRDEPQAQRIERVGDFVEGQGDKMGYTVVVEQDARMAELWMKPAGKNGIPAAFIVDGRGKVAWMGHPMQMDEPLGKIVKNEHDYAADAKTLQEQSYLSQVYRAFVMGVQSDDEHEAARGYEIGDAMARELASQDAGLLNSLAWTAVDDKRITHRDLDFAYRIANMAGEASEWNDPMILDTVAVAAYKVGEVARAIELEEKAISLADDDGLRESLEKQLEEFKSGG